jgi:hypothetical protein
MISGSSDDDNNFQGYLMFGFFSLIYILQFMDCTWGPSRSSIRNGAEVDNLMNITWILIL